MKKFKSLEEFHLYLLKINPTYDKKEVEFLEELGEVIKKTSKEKIGHLQQAAGIFEAWAPLAASTLKDKERKGYIFNSEGNPLFRTGELQESIDKRVDPISMGNKLVVGSTSEIAPYQEFGTPTIPPRSSLGATMFQSIDMIKSGVQQMIIKWLFSLDTSYELNNNVP